MFVEEKRAGEFVLDVPRKKTRQEIFDCAYRGLASQQWQRSVYIVGKIETCKYRGPNGIRCAIGWCIEDRFWKGRFEGHAINEIIASAAGIDKDDIGFAKRLQAIHDSHLSEPYLRMHLEQFAVKYDLTIPVLEE